MVKYLIGGAKNTLHSSEILQCNWRKTLYKQLSFSFLPINVNMLNNDEYINNAVSGNKLVHLISSAISKRIIDEFQLRI